MTPPTPSTPRTLRVTAALALACCAASPLAAQWVGPGTGGVGALQQDHRYLTEGRRVLVIGAHPDDEDTELITILSRGRGVETAYLSLTRGEGGQNLIGGELGPALGILRTEELLAARRIDGAGQYFTRAFDFGFSKTAAETFTFWPRDTLIKDVVRVIRRFRPDVIVSVWSGTPQDGHGHHQVSGIVAREAFDAAQDTTRFRDLAREEGLRPWRPLKFYRDYRAEGEGERFDGGELDPAVGQSYHQLAARSRSQHRSQDMGQLQDPGPSSRHIVLEAVAPGLRLAADTALFAGIPARASRDGELAGEVWLGEKGIVLDAYADDDEVVPGERVTITQLMWNASRDTIRASSDWLATAGFERGEGGTCSGQLAPVLPGEVRRCTTILRVTPTAAPGQPYFLQAPVEHAQYHFRGNTTAWGLPFAPPPSVRFRVEGEGGARSEVEREVMARSLDQGVGEVRRPLTIVPRVLMHLTPSEWLWRNTVPTQTIRVDVEHLAETPSDVVVRLAVPTGWRSPEAIPVHFDGAGEHRVVEFTLVRPDLEGTQTIAVTAEAIIGTDTLRVSGRRIEYPHVRPHLIFDRSVAHAVGADVVFPDGRRIGYLRGAADAIPEALRAAGVAYRLVTPAELEGTVLDSLDVLVIGPRAYEVDAAVARANSQLLAFAKRGGTLVVQYQQYQYIAGRFAPFPLTIARPHGRVTDETAPVRWLPGSEALAAGPNRLTAHDWKGWVQERGLYFAATWDSAWTPMVEMNDPGEAPLRGGILVARYGKGTVVYTGISFFRELPAAVPGAWRLFANLLALGGGT